MFQMATIPLSEENLVNLDAACMSLIDDAYEGIYVVDTHRTLLYWNKGAERITGYAAHEVLGRPCFDNILNHVDAVGRVYCFSGCPLEGTMSDGRTREAQLFLHHKEGHRVPIVLRTEPIYDESGSMAGAVEYFIDRVEQQQIDRAVEKYKELAMNDSLTGIANRRYLESSLTTRMSEFEVFGVSAGVLFLDIDHFKNINDTYGHALGDEVLKMVAHTLDNVTRATDLVGRYGGEEFVIICSGIDAANLEARADQFRKLVESSFIEHVGEQIRVTISIGATMLVAEDTVDSILRRADQLMYASKQAGRNRVTVG